MSSKDALSVGSARGPQPSAHYISTHIYNLLSCTPQRPSWIWQARPLHAQYQHRVIGRWSTGRRRPAARLLPFVRQSDCKLNDPSLSRSVLFKHTTRHVIEQRTPHLPTRCCQWCRTLVDQKCPVPIALTSPATTKIMYMAHPLLSVIN